MNPLPLLFILVAAYLGVFGEAAFGGLRHLLGAQPDLLPPLMVYASLSGGLTAITTLALTGGLLFDSISVNPLGVTVLPLFLVGMVIHASRDLVLKNQRFAQFILGMGASLAVPVMTLVLMMTGGLKPLLGWSTLWQLLVMSLSGAVLTPACFRFFALVEGALVHRRAAESSFRPDREIRRGRV